MLGLIIVQNLENITEFRSLPLLFMTKWYDFVEELNLISILSSVGSGYLLLAKREGLEYLLVDGSRILPHSNSDCERIAIAILLF